MSKNVTENSGIDVEQIFTKKYPILTREGAEGGFHSTVYILNEIGAPHEFVELLSLLASAETNDRIDFKFGTPGGRFDSTIILLDAFSKTKAVLIGDIVGDVASAGTILLMGMDDITVSKWGSMMIHNYSGGLFGKGGEIKERIAFEGPYLEKFFRDIYTPFLTKKECTVILGDKDKYMDAEEITERWGRVLAKREKQVKQYRKEYEANIRDAEIAAAMEILDKHAEYRENE